MSHLFNHAAFGYANLWWRKDRQFLNRMTQTDVTAVSNVLADIAVGYSVIRGIPGGRGYAGWAKIAKELISMRKLSAKTYVDVVERLQAELVRERQLLSAASKILWFHSQSPVKIYDARAVEALGFRKGSYSDYCRVWAWKFDESEVVIRRAIDKVVKHVDCTAIPPWAHNEFRNVSKKRWFAERVFDKYLWEQGGGEG
jgi:hypothetical protein